eukprot:s8602_g1.t1
MEEAAILDMLWTLLPPDTPLPPAITFATRNEFVFLAQTALAPPAFDRVRQLLDKFELDGSAIIRHPEPCYVDLLKSTEAEAIADSHLCEGAGALWSALRETVRSLEFQQDQRSIAGGKCIHVRLFKKKPSGGHQSGIGRDRGCSEEMPSLHQQALSSSMAGGSLPWKLGQRCVLIAYTVAQYYAARPKDIALLLEHGFLPPELPTTLPLPEEAIGHSEPE